jgi:transcriptional regulator with XRE-family HTH domain
VRESDAVENARRALGIKLATCRRAGGYSQADFASLIDYSRSSVANVETGRQHVPRGFWAAADAALRTEGALTEVNDAIEAAIRRERQDAARQSTPIPLSLVEHDRYAGSVVHVSGAALAARARDDDWLDVISLAATEARDHAEKAAITEIGPAGVEQFTADVVRLARAYVSAPPLPLFAAMRRSLTRAQAAIDHRNYPAQARDLNFLAGALCCLMANASLDLGRQEAADDLARAAWTYGRIIDHGALIGWARGTQALAAICNEQNRDAARHAEDGLLHAPAGSGAVRLHAIRARALSSDGDRVEALAAIAAAQRARAQAHRDELHDGIGGEFAFSDAKLSYYEALTLVEGDDPARAENAAEAAISLYQNGPAIARSYGCETLARAQLAKAQLINKKLEDAAETLGGVLSLDPQMHISSLNHQLETCRQLLVVPEYRSSGIARRLDRQLSEFGHPAGA